MRILISIFASLACLSLFVAPVFAAQTTTHMFGTATTTFSVQPLPINFPANSTNSNDTGSNSGNSSSGLGSALSAGGALVGIAALIYALTVPATAVSTAAVTASQAKGLSFGGRITLILPCLSVLGPSIWMTIVPAPATKQPLYIWTPTTLAVKPIPGTPISPVLAIPTPDVPPPTHPGQEILGVADIPYWCCLPPSFPTPVFGSCLLYVPGLPLPVPVPPLLGERIQWANQSPI